MDRLAWALRIRSSVIRSCQKLSITKSIENSVNLYLIIKLIDHFQDSVFSWFMEIFVICSLFRVLFHVLSSQLLSEDSSMLNDCNDLPEECTVIEIYKFLYSVFLFYCKMTIIICIHIISMENKLNSNRLKVFRNTINNFSKYANMYKINKWLQLQ